MTTPENLTITKSTSADKKALVNFINNFNNVDDNKFSEIFKNYLNEIEPILNNIFLSNNDWKNIIKSLVKDTLNNEEFKIEVEKIPVSTVSTVPVSTVSTVPVAAALSPFSVFDNDNKFNYEGGLYGRSKILSHIESTNEKIKILSAKSETYPQLFLSLTVRGIGFLTVGIAEDIADIGPLGVIMPTFYGVALLVGAAVVVVPAIVSLADKASDILNGARKSSYLNPTKSSDNKKRGGNSHRKKKAKTRKHRKQPSRKRRRTKK